MRYFVKSETRKFWKFLEFFNFFVILLLGHFNHLVLAWCWSRILQFLRHSFAWSLQSSFSYLMLILSLFGLFFGCLTPTSFIRLFLLSKGLFVIVRFCFPEEVVLLLLAKTFLFVRFFAWWHIISFSLSNLKLFNNYILILKPCAYNDLFNHFVWQLYNNLKFLCVLFSLDLSLNPSRYFVFLVAY